MSGIDRKDGLLCRQGPERSQLNMSLISKGLLREYFFESFLAYLTELLRIGGLAVNKSI